MVQLIEFSFYSNFATARQEGELIKYACLEAVAELRFQDSLIVG